MKNDTKPNQLDFVTSLSLNREFSIQAMNSFQDMLRLFHLPQFNLRLKISFQLLLIPLMLSTPQGI